MSRPDHVKCIAHTHAELEGQSWCGRKIDGVEWAFVDVDHAAYAARSGERLTPCEGCVAEVAAAFDR